MARWKSIPPEQEVKHLIWSIRLILHHCIPPSAENAFTIPIVAPFIHPQESPIVVTFNCSPNCVWWKESSRRPLAPPQLPPSRMVYHRTEPSTDDASKDVQICRPEKAAILSPKVEWHVWLLVVTVNHGQPLQREWNSLSHRCRAGANAFSFFSLLGSVVLKLLITFSTDS